MAADNQLGIRHRFAGQHGDYVIEIHILEDALPVAFDMPLIEPHLKTGVIALHLIENPLARGSDAVIGHIGGREQVAGLEAGEVLNDVVNAGFRYFVNDFANLGIDSELIGGGWKHARHGR